MPSGLHGQLARAAEREGTSLNGYIIARLGEAVGRPADSPDVRHRERSTTTLTWLLVANVAAVALAALAALVIVLVATFG
jgi:hypothetical protein